jgi:hypothetical protein
MGGGMSVKPVLENDERGFGIDLRLALLPGQPPFAQVCIGFG